VIWIARFGTACTGTKNKHLASTVQRDGGCAVVKSVNETPGDNTSSCFSLDLVRAGCVVTT
jgi:hypothetical protein